MIDGVKLSGLARAPARRKRRELVEFTMIAPFLGLLTVAIADYSRGFSERFALENAAHRTLERAESAHQERLQLPEAGAATAADVPSRM
jgi:Flp pilus assembly protein TadG